MIRQPVVMEAELGRLISSLTPASVKKVFTVKDSGFQQILWILGLEGRVKEDRYPNISFEIEVGYTFQGLKNLPTGGWVAVYYSRVWICPKENGSDFGWNVEVYCLHDLWYGDLNILMKTAKVVEMDTPDVEEVNLVRIDIITEKLADNGKYWRIRR